MRWGVFLGLHIGRSVKVNLLSVVFLQFLSYPKKIPKILKKSFCIVFTKKKNSIWLLRKYSMRILVVRNLKFILQMRQPLARR